MNKLEIIQELLVDTYAKNPKLRAVNDMENCRYTTEDGRHCAVGMCMTKESETNFGDFMGSFPSLIDLHDIDNHDSLLQEKYRGHGLDFWQDMQIFHDTHLNFTETGLSEIGEFRLLGLQERHE